MPPFTWVFRISEPANRFHVLSNLAEWSFQARTAYNRAWIEETGLVLPLVQDYLGAGRSVDDALLESAIATFHANRHTLH